MLLVEKYRPQTISEFVGIDDPRADAASLVRNPYSSAWYFVGASGTGKTSLALAIAAELKAEIHHIPSQSCTVDTVKQLRHSLQLTSMFSKWKVVIVDEAEEMSAAAENAWLSLTDSTNRPPDTIIIFTANGTEKLSNPERFLSRCDVVKFSTHGLNKEITALLETIWEAETEGLTVEAPNFSRIAKEANNNVRESLQVLQRYIRRASRG